MSTCAEDYTVNTALGNSHPEAVRRQCGSVSRHAAGVPLGPRDFCRSGVGCGCALRRAA